MIITLVSDTLLAGGYARPSRHQHFPEFALELTKLSVKPIRKTHLKLDVPPIYGYDGKFFGLHSGGPLSGGPSPTESGLQRSSSASSPEGIFVARIHNRDAKTNGISVYFVVLRLRELLELVEWGGDIPWKRWNHCTFTQRKVYSKPTFSDLCVSGWRLIGPLEEINQGHLVTEIYEFSGMEVEKRETEGAEEAVSKVLEPTGVILEFPVVAEDPEGSWMTLTIAKDNIILVEVCGSLY